MYSSVCEALYVVCATGAATAVGAVPKEQGRTGKSLRCQTGTWSGGVNREGGGEGECAEDSHACHKATLCPVHEIAVVKCACLLHTSLHAPPEDGAAVLAVPAVTCYSLCSWCQCTCTLPAATEQRVHTPETL